MTPIKQEILQSVGASYWLKNAIRETEKRDPLNALRDAEFLVEVLKAEWEALTTR